jgi:hypothetical protein
MLESLYRALLAASILSAATPGAPASGGGLPPSGFTVGEPFPLIAFETGDGEPVESTRGERVESTRGELVETIASFRGEKVVLHIFASW